MNAEFFKMTGQQQLEYLRKKTSENKFVLSDEEHEEMEEENNYSPFSANKENNKLKFI